PPRPRVGRPARPQLRRSRKTPPACPPSVEQLDRDEADLGVAGVLEVVDHHVVRTVVLVLRLADPVLPDPEAAVRRALAADAAVHHRPEVAARVGVKGTALAGLEAHLPDLDVLVHVEEPGADRLVPRCLRQLRRELSGVEGPGLENPGLHLVASLTPSMRPRVAPCKGSGSQASE